LLDTCDYQKESKDGYHTNIDTSHSDNDEDNGSQSTVSDRFKGNVLALRNQSFILY